MNKLYTPSGWALAVPSVQNDVDNDAMHLHLFMNYYISKYTDLARKLRIMAPKVRESQVVHTRKAAS